ncbi:putative diguanylate cyclase YdaM [Tepidimonas fonticaldi]|uniref:diguanylate cyclase n=1 Tax=Tepidimonas fonticaldi TaxID=1101373 RepID=A0A554XQF9_9BURK|nr:GGDEF domain-containing protein [Tepidimonas fonticaldi]TSE38064.1 putative diguanylate cyclase YdaM [Tepidimonas fonticaldi]
MTIRETWRRWADEDRQVQDSAVRRNLQVLSLAAWVLVALNAVHIAVFGLLTFDEPVRDGWARQIATAHGAMAVVMALTGWLARRLHARPVLPIVGRILPLAVSAVVLAWAIVLTVMDQAVSSSVNPYVNAAVGVAIVLLLRPSTMVGLMGMAWVALAWVLGGTTDDPAVLATNRMNAASATALAILVSILFWRHYARTELLQRALAESNRQLEAQRAELEALATRDPLTGLLNRREFVRQAEHELARARRLGAPLTLIMLDLDHFKAINDRHGHAVGDEVLRQTARYMAGSTRQTDRVARFGGEEFVLLLPDTSAEQAWHLADKLREGLARVCIPTLGVPVTASLGVASVLGTESVTLEAVLHRADQAMYEAKRSGRNRTVVAADAGTGAA